MMRMMGWCEEQRQQQQQQKNKKYVDNKNYMSILLNMLACARAARCDVEANHIHTKRHGKVLILFTLLTTGDEMSLIVFAFFYFFFLFICILLSDTHEIGTCINIDWGGVSIIVTVTTLIVYLNFFPFLCITFSFQGENMAREKKIMGCAKFNYDDNNMMMCYGSDAMPTSSNLLYLRRLSKLHAMHGASLRDGCVYTEGAMQRDASQFFFSVAFFFTVFLILPQRNCSFKVTNYMRIGCV